MQYPPLDHLAALTDDVGVLQHAVHDVPNRTCGYCIDDVGRALVVACDAASRPETAAVGGRLVRTYLSYLFDAQLPSGWFHNFMGYDRRWQDREGTQDAVGRAVWGLGYAEAHAPRDSWRMVANRLRARALPAIDRMAFIRSHAYAILGLAQALTAKPADAFAIRARLACSASAIADAYDAHAGPGWAWCEDVMTYDNGRLPEALLRASVALGDERYRRIGLAMLDFYASVTIETSAAGGRPVFVPVGNDGWYPRGGVKARYAQQPLEAAALVDAALLALDLTGEERWRGVAECAHAWYLGANTTGAVLASADGGCCDGLGVDCHNGNMGAESTLAYLMSASALARRSGDMLLLAR